MEFMNALPDLATSVMAIVTSKQVIDAVLFVFYVTVTALIVTLIIQVIRDVSFRRRQKKAYQEWKAEYEARAMKQREERILEEQRWYNQSPKQRTRLNSH